MGVKQSKCFLGDEFENNQVFLMENVENNAICENILRMYFLLVLNLRNIVQKYR